MFNPLNIDLQLMHTDPIFADPNVIRLSFRLWLSDDDADEGRMSLRSEPLAIACAKQLDFLEDNTPFLNAALDAYDQLDRTGGRNGELARIAIKRLDASLQKASGVERLREVMNTINTLWIIAKENDSYGNKRELGSNPKGLSSVIRAISVIIEDSFVWFDHRDTIHRGLDLIQTQTVVDETAAVGRVIALLQNGLLSTFHALCQSFHDIRDGEVQAMLRILDKVKQLLMQANLEVAAAALDDAYELPADIHAPVQDMAILLDFIKKVVLDAPLPATAAPAATGNQRD